MPPRSGRRRLQAWLAGPPFQLPPTVDRLAERWAAAGPRLRLAAGVLAALLLLTLTGLRATRSPWGPEVPAVVAARDLHAGHALTADDVRTVTWPQRLVPAGAPRHPGDVTGQFLAVGAAAGSLLTAAHLDDGGVAARLPAGRVAYPLPLPDGVRLAAGQRVDLVAGDGDRGGLRLAADAQVLAVDATHAWVAVSRDEAPALAGAAASGGVVVVLLPPS